MTKVIILGENQVVEKEQKRIRFVSCLKVNFKFTKEGIEETMTQPHEYEFIELICKNYADGFDLMLAYNYTNKRGEGTLFKGYFNDGVV